MSCLSAQVAKPEENMLSPANVLFMQAFEKKLYTKCRERAGVTCSIPQTLLPYLYPPDGGFSLTGPPEALTEEQIVDAITYASQTDLGNPLVQQRINAGYPPPIGDKALLFGGPEMTAGNNYQTETIAARYTINEPGTPDTYTFWGEFISGEATEDITIVFTNQVSSICCVRDRAFLPTKRVLAMLTPDGVDAYRVLRVGVGVHF